MSDYIEVSIEIKQAEDFDALSEQIVSLDPDGLWEDEDSNFLFCYFEKTVFTKAKSDLAKILTHHKWAYKDQEKQNWNKVWESNFEPVEVDDICYIFTDFHPANPGLPFEIIIHPQMAFGTGHHPTTYMMIKAIHQLKVEGKNIFDYGCGTGILSVFALLKGAHFVFGNDIQPESIENSNRHMEINNIPVGKYEFLEGDMGIVPQQTYPIVLANINRFVLLETAEKLMAKVEKGGDLLLSGLLDSDFDLVHGKYGPSLELITKDQREDWLMLHYKKS